MLHLSNLRLPTDWADRCTTLSRALVTSARFQQILGQLYDGQQTWDTFLEAGDILALLTPGIPRRVSNAALEDVGEWIEGLTTRLFRLDDFWANELERLFECTEDTRERVLGLTLCLFKPLVRWHAVRYFQHLQAMGKQPPLFCQKYHSAEPEIAIQDWSEERVWGGLLSLERGKLTVSPLIRPAFVVDSERLLGLSDGFGCLPFQPTHCPRRKPRLEDDQELYNYVRHRADRDGN